MVAAPSLVDLGGRRLVLASSSPRRRDLLALLGAEFDVEVPDVDERPRPGEAPATLVVRLAHAKAAAVAVRRPEGVVVAADTVVTIEGRLLGKPVDDDDAASMLRLLATRRHEVHTGVAVAVGGDILTDRTCTAVSLGAISADELHWYLGTGDALDKAGGYSLLGAAAPFVRSVEGSVGGVLGLPLDVVLALLRRAATAR